MEETTGQRFARMIAERKGITTEEHLRRLEQARKEREAIREENGDEDEEE